MPSEKIPRVTAQVARGATACRCGLTVGEPYGRRVWMWGLPNQRGWVGDLWRIVYNHHRINTAIIKVII